MSLPTAKQKRFWPKENDLNAPLRYLNDNLCDNKALEYIACLFNSEEKHKVIATKGKYTSQLRKHWELQYLLRPNDVNLKK